MPSYISIAFAPDGVDREFKPLGNAGSLRTYAMRVFDRFGGLVFESRDISRGWDGARNGRPLPPAFMCI